MKQFIALFCVTSLFSMTGCADSGPDLLIRGARVYDGTGKPGYVMDIAVTDGFITDMGINLPVSGNREIHASGLVAAPGFIDAHSHADWSLWDLPDNACILRQGITTCIAGQCGASPVHLSGFFEKINTRGMTTNLALLVGQGSLRDSVMGETDAQPTAAQLRRMEDLVTQAMQEGAFGLSTGLEYVPGAYAGIDELAALAARAAAYGGIYATHMRDEGAGIEEAIREALEIGRRAGLPVQISHLKICHQTRWGQARKILDLLESARQEGLTVYADQYPYTAWMSSLTILAPPWSREGGRDAFRARLVDPDTRSRIVGEILEDWGEQSERPERMIVAIYTEETEYEGKSLRDICLLRGMEPTDRNAAQVALDLMAAGEGSVIGRMMDETGCAHVHGRSQGDDIY